MVFNATSNNILVILWWSVFLVEEIGVPGKNTDKLHHIMLYRVHFSMNGIRTQNISNDRH